MDHKAFCASLPREVMASLHETEDATGLWHLAGHCALILFFGTWIAAGWTFWQVALVGQGIAICFLFTLEHEATHKTPFRSPWLNEWAGRFCGLMIFLPFEWFRYFHLAHHRWTNIPGKDPELLAGGKPETVWAYVRYVSGLPYWLAAIRQILANALGRDPGDYVPARARRRIATEARWLLVIYGGLFSSLLYTPVLFWVWLLPVLLGQPFLRLYLLAEHGRCAPVANMFENTRTTYTNRIVRFLAWNMSFHVEHHSLPQVPYHRLPELNRLMDGRHAVTANGYRAFSAEYAAHLGRTGDAPK